MLEPKISIIVPIYNVEKYLEKCIQSILNQTFNDFELILVDDGSPDGCADICDKYQAVDTRVQVIHKKNGGLSDARNAGLELARGDYIGFVDSDDFIAENMYELLYENIQNSHADIAICNYTRVDEQDNLIDKKDAYYIPDYRCYEQEEFVEEMVQEYGGYFVVTVNKLYKKEIFENLRFPIGKQHEDEFLIHRIIGKCHKIVCIKEVLYFYLQREGSIMNKKSSLGYMNFGEALIDRYHYTKEKGYVSWKEHTVIRLSYELERWRKEANENLEIKKYYNSLRKKARFLIFEKASWKGTSLKGQLYHKIELLFPKR